MLHQSVLLAVRANSVNAKLVKKDISVFVIVLFSKLLLTEQLFQKSVETSNGQCVWVFQLVK